MTATYTYEKTFELKEGSEVLEGYTQIMCTDCTFNALMLMDVHALIRYQDRRIRYCRGKKRLIVKCMILC